MSASGTAFSGGFENPVHQSQNAFRVIMDCMARPGTIGQFQAGSNPPAPMNLAQSVVALSLCDHDTPIWLSHNLATSPIAKWLAFHTGASVTDDRSNARFAFVDGATSLPPFAVFAKGTQDYPDRSTTVVVEIEGLEGGPKMTLAGPGILGTAIFAPRGLPAPFGALWAENRALFPRGVDLILTSGDQLVCLPRSVRIVEREVM